MENKHEYKKKNIKNLGEILYIPKKNFKETYPMENVGYSILGFIGDGMAEPIGEWKYKNEIRPFYAFKKKGYFYKVIGYVEVGEDTYIAVIQRKLLRGLLPFLLLLGILLSLILYMMAPKGPDLENGMDKYIPRAGITENTDPSRIVFPGLTEFKMESDTDTSYTALFNPEGNPCYFKFIITLNKTNDVIYESKLIPPGYAVTGVQFDRKFPAGVYPITVKITTFSLDDYTMEMNGGDIEAIIASIER